MELTLSHLTDSQIVVVCDQQFSHTFDLTPLLLDIENGLVELSIDAISYGDMLYAALFAENTAAAHILESQPSRIVLIIPEEDLEIIPWEYVHGPGGFLVLQYPFVRGQIAEQYPNPPVLDSETGLHLVAIPANPIHPQTDEAVSMVDEWQNLLEIVQEVTLGLTMERIHPATIEQLQRLTAPQHNLVLHFVGYGEYRDGETFLCFEQKNGFARYVSVTEFLQSVTDKALLVTLNACVTDDPGPTPFCTFAASLTRHDIPYALAIRTELDEEDACTFFYTLYRELAQGTPIETAVLAARTTLALSDSWSIGIPVLYTALKEPLAGIRPSLTTLTVEAYQPWNDIEALPRVEEGQFQGRALEIQMLAEKLSADAPWGLFTLQGPAGQGKTTLVREALEYFASNWSGGIYVTRLGPLSNKDTFLYDLARFLQLEVQPLIDYATLERQVLDLLSQHRTLLVLNHAEILLSTHIHEHTELAQFIREQLLRTTNNMLAISELPLGWPGETIYQLGGLTPEDGADLLLQRAQQGQDKPARSLLQQLSVMVAGHPLSLCLLGRALPAETRELPEFIRNYTVHLHEAEQRDPGADHLPHAYYAALATGVDYLPTISRSVLQQISIFHAPFAEEFAASVLDTQSEPEVTNVTEHPLYAQFVTLYEHGFLTRELITSGNYTLLFYQLLPTIRLYLEQALPLGAERELLYQRMEKVYTTLAYLVFSPTSSEPLWLSIAAYALADLERCGTYIPPQEMHWHQLYLAWVFTCMGNRTRAIALLKTLLKQRPEQLIYKEYQFLKGVANIYIHTGFPGEALELYQRALAAARQQSDPASEAAILTDSAEIMAQYFCDPCDALHNLERAVEILTTQNLSKDACDRTLHDLEAQICALNTTNEAFDDDDDDLNILPTPAMAQELVTAIYACISTNSLNLDALRAVFKTHQNTLFLPAVEKSLVSNIAYTQANGNQQISNLLEERLLLIRACKDSDIDTIFNQLKTIQ